MSNAIRRTIEFERIAQLPRRVATAAASFKLVQEMTRILRTPLGQQTLRPLQALALYEIGMLGGGLVAMGVGDGKTIVSLLSANVLEAQRPMLFNPAKLLEKTARDQRRYSVHWQIPNNIRPHSYELMSRVQSTETLEGYRPDLLIFDEAHHLKNLDAAVVKKIVRYMQGHPDTRVVLLSGTFIDRSILEFAHSIQWALKGELVPIPRERLQQQEWASALDEPKKGRDGMLPRRMDPGPLLDFCDASPFEFFDLPAVRARRGFQRRLVETPGVIATAGNGESCKASIYVSAITYSMSKITDDHFTVLRRDKLTPDGWDLEPLDVWRHARELALGYHNIWDPRPPEDWANARRDWFSYVRRVLGASKRLDSPEHVQMALDEGHLKSEDGHKLLATWRTIYPRFVPNPVPIWHDDSALVVAAKWMGNNPEGIVWVEHVAFGDRLSQLTGRPYFREEQLNARGGFIEDAHGPIIASVDACREGVNLQRWSRNLITAMQEGPSVIQQLIGRTHRTGQSSDEVVVDVLLGCAEHVKAWRACLAGTIAVQDMTGANQKLTIADLSKWPSEDEIDSWSGPRWRTPKETPFRIPGV
jgi:hypothetical protein